MQLLAAMLFPFFSALIRVVLGTAAATTTFNYLNDNLKPKFDEIMGQVTSTANELGSVSGMAGDMYNFIGVTDMINTIVSALSAVLVIKIYMIAIKAFASNPLED